MKTSQYLNITPKTSTLNYVKSNVYNIKDLCQEFNCKGLRLKT